MIITRNVPSEFQVEGINFHPGSQHIPDELYHKKLKNNPAFLHQLETGKNGHSLMTITVPAEKEIGNGKQSLAETVKSLPENKAIEIIQRTVDGVDLQEIIKGEKRRKVVAAAEKQIKDRQGFMDGMAPRMPPTSGEPIDLGIKG